MFSLIAVLFIVLAMKIYPILCFVAQFSQFPCYKLQIVHAENMYQVADA